MHIAEQGDVHSCRRPAFLFHLSCLPSCTNSKQYFSTRRCVPLNSRSPCLLALGADMSSVRCEGMSHSAAQKHDFTQSMDMCQIGGGWSVVCSMLGLALYWRKVLIMVHKRIYLGWAHVLPGAFGSDARRRQRSEEATTRQLPPNSAY